MLRGLTKNYGFKETLFFGAYKPAKGGSPNDSVMPNNASRWNKMPSKKIKR